MGDGRWSAGSACGVIWRREFDRLVPDLSDDEFQALIERMAQLQYKYEARRAEDFFDRQSSQEKPSP